MSSGPCHTKPFVQPGVVIERGDEQQSGEIEYQNAVQESCDYCGSPGLEWRKCKLICANCNQINKSCADL